MKLFLCLIAIVALTCGATIERVSKQRQPVPRLLDNRIVGGEETNIVKYPHQISMRYKSLFAPQTSFVHRCGGSIYKKDIILTAAHCVIATVPSQYQIVAGTNYRTANDGIIVPVKEIIMHENYDPDYFDNDIAIMILGTALPLNNFTTKSIELATENPRHGAMSTITGWGAIREGGIASNLLQEVHVPIVSNEVCNEDYGGSITDSMLCAGYRGIGGKDACQGDSGGPLLVNGKLAGIVSWGYGCARPQFPGIYAKISYLHEWIERKVAPYLDNE